MGVSSFLFVSWIASLLLAFAMALSGQILSPLAVAAIAALCLWILLSIFRWRLDWPKPSKWLLFGVFVLYVALGIQAYLVSKDIVYVFGWGIIGAFPWALHGSADERGYWRAFGVVGFGSLVCLISSDSFITFVLYIVMAPVLLMKMNAAHLRFHLLRGGNADEILPRSYFYSLLGSILPGLLVGTVVFAFFPRSFQWRNPLALRSKDSISGYNGKIELGANNIAVSSQLAFIVESPDPEIRKSWLPINGPSLYFKANVLDRFDGKTWSRSEADYVPYFVARSIRQTRAFDRSREIPLRIFREPHSTRAVLYPGVLRNLRVPWALRSQLRQDKLGNLERSSSETTRYAYDLDFSPLSFPEREVSQSMAIYFETDRKTPRYDGPGEYLQLPDGLAEARWFRAFVDEAVGKDVNGAFSDLTLGQSLDSMRLLFQSKFKAGYQGETFNTKDIQAFVSETRYGHCEYFATAAVLALRARGIPARIVLGYRGGAFNPVSGVLEVRESEAHAWAEYFIPEVGWLPFEATPISPRLFPGNWLERGFLVYTAIKFWFERYLVDYSMETQKSVFEDLRLLPKQNQTRRYPWRALAAICVAVMLVGGIFQISRYRRRKLARLPSYWKEFERRSRRRGGEPRRIDETLLAYSLRVERYWPESLARKVYAAVEAEIYGGRSPVSLPDLLHEIRNARA